MTGKLTNSNVCIVPYGKSFVLLSERCLCSKIFYRGHLFIGFSEIVSTTDFEVLTINALGKWFSALDENIS